MHSPAYLAICAASLGVVHLLKVAGDTTMVFVAASAVALLGVPHGGLDHWTGRRLLENRFEHRWWIVFFPAYLIVGLTVASGWFLAPTITVVLFFLLSAWHFGREDQKTNVGIGSPGRKGQLFDHISAVAIGGLVIWVPALARPSEFHSLLSLVVPAGAGESVDSIVEATQYIAWCLVPLAIVMVVQGIVATPRDLGRWVPLASTAIAFGLPILLSFSIYFCGWHSWQGLQRLRRDESLGTLEFLRCVAPMSLSAIFCVAAVGWWTTRWLAGFSLDVQTAETLRVLFIGLSSLAVPHLVLQELHALAMRSQPNRQVVS